MPDLLIPFAFQCVLAIAAFAAALRIARASRPVWVGVCIASLAAMLLWPLMRVFPVEPIDLLGAPTVACIELTGLAIPAVLLFAIAARHMPKKSDGRAILLLTAVAGVYFVKAGWWMLAPVSGGLGPTNVDAHGVCRQSTGYTCAAASMVTMLRARDIPADETEMARLSYTQVGGGATDSRVLWALERKLAATELRPRYQRLDLAGLIAASKPCLVQLDWGYFTSHMVPVLSATEQTVVIGDPLIGKREMSAADFVRKWKGAAITVESVFPPSAQ
ncbi:MAG: cysteine peptidase family C39 domain-containing protein [Phycisphaerales bacterium]